MIERLENPVFRQSSRQRMRGARTYGCLIVYLLILGLVVVIAYTEFTRQTSGMTTGLAQTLFEALTLTQWFLVAFVTPALTTSAITMEREQRTLDLLIITPLSRFAIVWGKFASALAFVMLLIICGLPVVAVLFLLGGVDVLAVLTRYAGMLLTGALLAAFGVSMSAMCGSSTLANLLTYGSLAVLYMFGVGLGTALVMSRILGGYVSGMPWLGAGISAWQVWLLILIGVLLLTILFLQIGANYLLPDPRVGAWKTRLWVALIYFFAIAAAVWGLRVVPATKLPNAIMGEVMVMLPLIAIAVSTGVPMSGRRWYQWLSPRALAIGTVQTGVVYLFLLLLIAILCDQFVPASYRSSWLAWAYGAGYLWWLWSLGYAFSVLVGNRWGAAAMLVGFLFLGAQFIASLAAFASAGWLRTTYNLFTPTAIYGATGTAMADLRLWAMLYPVLGLFAALSAAWLRHRRLSRDGQKTQ